MAGVVFTLAARGDIRGLVFPTPLPHTLVSFSPDPLGAPGRYIPAGQQRLTVGFFSMLTGWWFGVSCGIGRELGPSQ